MIGESFNLIFFSLDKLLRRIACSIEAKSLELLEAPRPSPSDCGVSTSDSCCNERPGGEPEEVKVTTSSNRICTEQILTESTVWPRMKSHIGTDLDSSAFAVQTILRLSQRVESES